jgi:hypothetical protein
MVAGRSLAIRRIAASAPTRRTGFDRGLASVGHVSATGWCTAGIRSVMTFYLTPRTVLAALYGRMPPGRCDTRHRKTPLLVKRP